MTFLDIETVPQHNELVYVNSETEFLFEKKFGKELLQSSETFTGNRTEALEIIWKEKAALYAEFGKIVCIGLGKLVKDKFIIKTICSRDEKSLLERFCESIAKPGNEVLCAHNGKEFDFPYIMRRLVINGLPVPPQLNVIGKKPWEVNLEDTIQMWSGTQWNYKCSLELLCHVLGLPSPKGEMDGKSVADIFYGACDVPDDQLPFDKEEAALRAIAKYCGGDVFAMANCYFRMKGMPTISESQIEYAA